MCAGALKAVWAVGGAFGAAADVKLLAVDDKDDTACATLNGVFRVAGAGVPLGFCGMSMYGGCAIQDPMLFSPVLDGFWSCSRGHQRQRGGEKIMDLWNWILQCPDFPLVFKARVACSCEVFSQTLYPKPPITASSADSVDQTINTSGNGGNRHSAPQGNQSPLTFNRGSTGVVQHMYDISTS